MKQIIGIIQKSAFVESDCSEVLQGHFTEFSHKTTAYMRINTFEHYASSNMFEQIFLSESEFNAWLTEVPVSITKLQAVKQFLIEGTYNNLIAALEADATGESKILFDSAHRLDRESKMVNNIALVLNMTSDDVDTFFIDASKIIV